MTMALTTILSSQVNHLFQEQCGRVWIRDVSGDVEGVVIRKSRGNYLACPPALMQSPFMYYCSLLNVQVDIPELV
jgi:hypothetical protein